MRDQGLMFAIDLHKNTFELGVEIVENGEVVGLDQRLESLAAFGATPEQIAEFEQQMQQQQ